MLNIMSLSRENSDKLKTFIKENNSINNNSVKNPQETYDSSEIDAPSRIFYYIIDNSDNISETSKENPLLKKTEQNFHNINSRNINYLNNLSIEDELYDEFNYLLDE